MDVSHRSLKRPLRGYLLVRKVCHLRLAIPLPHKGRGMISVPILWLSDYGLLPAGAVAATTVSTIRTGISILAVWSMVAPHTVAMPMTSTVSLAVSSTRTRIRRNLACLELEINPLIAHFCLQVADLSL